MKINLFGCGDAECILVHVYVCLWEDGKRYGGREKCSQVPCKCKFVINKCKPNVSHFVLLMHNFYLPHVNVVVDNLKINSIRFCVFHISFHARFGFKRIWWRESQHKRGYPYTMDTLKTYMDIIHIQFNVNKFGRLFCSLDCFWCWSFFVFIGSGTSLRISVALTI